MKRDGLLVFIFIGLALALPLGFAINMCPNDQSRVIVSLIVLGVYLFLWKFFTNEPKKPSGN